MTLSNLKAKKPAAHGIVTALMFLTAAFFFVQLVADHMLSKKESEPPIRSRQMPASLSLLPSLSNSGMLSTDLLADEFFSSPFMFDSDLLSIKKEMDRQRDLMFKSLQLEPPSSSSFGKMFEPVYKVKEDDDKITVTVSVPDVDLKDIDIEIVDGRVMHISGTKKVESRGMVSQTSFDKRFALGSNVDQDHIRASLKKGELTVETPKWKEIEKEHKVKKIAIKEEL